MLYKTRTRFLEIIKTVSSAQLDLIHDLILVGVAGQIIPWK